MLLSDRDIKAAMGMGWDDISPSKPIWKTLRGLAERHDRFLRITPYQPSQLQPASYDLRLGKGWIFTGESGDAIDVITMHPQMFLLAHTEEIVTLPSWLAGRVEGKSSWARKGLFVHTTAGWIDPGFSGQITLELFNAGSETITLKPGDLISQVSFYLLSSPAERPYGSKGLGSHYQGQRGATRSWVDSKPSGNDVGAAVARLARVAAGRALDAVYGGPCPECDETRGLHASWCSTLYPKPGFCSTCGSTDPKHACSAKCKCDWYGGHGQHETQCPEYRGKARAGEAGL